MTYKELKTAMDTVAGAIEVPVTYYMWPSGAAPEPPYLIWYLPESDDFMADDTNYVSISKLYMELYTDNKEPAKEMALQTALNSAGFVYTKEEQYISTENMYEVLYESEVILNG